MNLQENTFDRIQTTAFLQDTGSFHDMDRACMKLQFNLTTLDLGWAFQLGWSLITVLVFLPQGGMQRRSERGDGR